MKKPGLFPRILIMIIALTAATVATADCTMQLAGFAAEQDVSYTLNDNNGAPDGQTFTACENGVVTSVAIKMDTFNDYTGLIDLWVGLEPGDGNNLTGPVYQQFEVTAENMTGVAEVRLSPPFPVEAGTIYRVEFDLPDDNDFAFIDANAFTGDLYPEGVGVEAGIYDSIANVGVEADMNFSIRIERPAAAVPVMSPFGTALLVFALIALMFARRRRLI